MENKGLSYAQFDDSLMAFIGSHVGEASDKLWRRLSAGWDGNQFCILLGADLQEGQGFFGGTPEEAFRSFFAAILGIATPDLLAELEATRAVHVTAICPNCGTSWSDGECYQMEMEQEASCLCGYRQATSGAAIAKAKGE